MRLWTFAVESYGAQASFDHGETNEDFDGSNVIVGHQYAGSLSEAKQAMAEELAENAGFEKPEEPDMEDDNVDVSDWAEWEEQIESIKDMLLFFELAPDGQHNTMFLS